MINNAEFADRLRTIMDYYQLSGSAFADRIQVQRSSISHLLSGRNKPSLDFVMRVVKEFDEVELYWLLNGKGSFPDKPVAPGKSIARDSEKPVSLPPVFEQKKVSQNVVDQNKVDPNPNEIERIVVFYKDGTFKSYSSL